MPSRSLFLCLAVLAATPPALAGGLRGEIQLDVSISPGGAHRSADPRVVVDGTSVHAVWRESAVGTSLSEDVWYCRSTDGGRTWDDPLRLDGDDIDDDEAPQVAAHGDLVAVAWLHGSPQDVRVAISSDGGATFGPPQDVSGALSGDAGDADHLRLALQDAFVYVSFEDDAASPGGAEDVYVVASIDGGVTFEDPVRVNDAAAGTFDADDPELATSGAEASLVWVDERGGQDQVWYSRSGDGGASWSANLQLDFAPAGSDRDAPRLAVRDKVHVVWLDDRHPQVGDQVYYNRSLDGGVSFETDRAIGGIPPGTDMDDARVALGKGRWVYVAWADDRNGPGRDVFVAASSDNGSTFFVEQALDSDAGTVDSFDPRLAADRQQVYVAYQEDDGSGAHSIWLAFSTARSAASSWQVRLLSEGLPAGADADAQQVAVTDFRDAVAIWVDDRAGSGNSANDVYVNGQRLPELVVEPVGQKLRFRLENASESEDGKLMLCLFSTTGTAWTALPDPSGIHVALTVDATTLLLSRPLFFPLFTDEVESGAAATVPVKLPFGGWAAAVIVDLGKDPPTFPAATDPIGF